MAGLSGNQSVAQVLAKNLSNLMDSEKVESSYTAFVEQQNSDKTAVIGPIKISLNDSKDTETVVSDLSGTGTERSIYVPTPPEEIKRSTKEEIEATFAQMNAEVENLENVKKTEIYPEGQTRADTLVQREKIRARNDYEIKELDKQIDALQAEIDASNFNEPKTKLEMLDEQIAMSDAKIAEANASIAASNASILESKKSIAKSDAAMLQTEINEEMSEAQTERFEKISKQIAEEQSGGDAAGAQLNKLTEIKNKFDEEKQGGETEGQEKEQFKQKIIKGLSDAEKRKAATREFNRVNSVSDNALIKKGNIEIIGEEIGASTQDKTVISGDGTIDAKFSRDESTMNADKSSQIKGELKSEKGKSEGKGDGDSWRTAYYEGGKGTSNIRSSKQMRAKVRLYGDDGKGCSPAFPQTKYKSSQRCYRGK